MAAPPVAPEAPDPPPEDGDAAAAIAAAARGLLAFAIVTAVGVAIGMAEYAATKGAYRPWTWIKVGFLYLLSFCGVGLRVDSSVASGFGGGETRLQFRFPMMVCTALVVGLLFEVGRSLGRRMDGRGLVVGVVAAAAAFAVPSFLVSLPATLRFPGIATVSPIRWESAILPLALALCAAAAGAFWGRRAVGRESAERRGWVVAMLEGGWHMFVLAVGLAFLGFLTLAAAKPDGTAAYARFVRDSGRIGAITAAHHVLFLPDQSIWLLGPAMGGSTRVVVFGAEPFPTTVTMSGIEEGELGGLFDPVRAFGGSQRLPLGGGFYLFLLIPLAATVFGGRRAAAGSSGVRERSLRGLGAGVVFGALMGAAALFSVAAVPLSLPGFGILPMSIRAAMPSTAVLALAWGIAGGVSGALSSAWPVPRQPG